MMMALNNPMVFLQVIVFYKHISILMHSFMLNNHMILPLVDILSFVILNHFVGHFKCFGFCTFIRNFAVYIFMRIVYILLHYKQSSTIVQGVFENMLILINKFT